MLSLVAPCSGWDPLGWEEKRIHIFTWTWKPGVGPHGSGCVTQSSTEPFLVPFLPGSPKPADNSLGAWQGDNQPAKGCTRKVPSARLETAARGPATHGTVALRCQEVSTAWAWGTHAACPRQEAPPWHGCVKWGQYKIPNNSMEAFPRNSFCFRSKPMTRSSVRAG